MPVTVSDFKVADLNLAGWGRREIAIAESEMPALMAIRAVPVPAYTTNTVADHAHILRDAGIRAAIVAAGRVPYPDREESGAVLRGVGGAESGPRAVHAEPV